MNRLITMVVLAAQIAASALTPEPTNPPEPTVIQETEPKAYTPSVPPEFNCAHIVWEKLRKAGYSEPVTAGILGNIMAECAGGTFRLNWGIYGESGSYYGICQWNRWDFPEVQGQDLLFQVDYLISTMQHQMGSRYESFCEMQSPRDAALCFAKNYERCASFSYGVRQKYAADAYEYWSEK